MNGRAFSGSHHWLVLNERAKYNHTRNIDRRGRNVGIFAVHEQAQKGAYCDCFVFLSPSGLSRRRNEYKYEMQAMNEVVTYVLYYSRIEGIRPRFFAWSKGKVERGTRELRMRWKEYMQAKWTVTSKHTRHPWNQSHKLAVKWSIVMTGEDNYRNLWACWPQNVKLGVRVGELRLQFEICKNEN